MGNCADNDPNNPIKHKNGFEFSKDNINLKFLDLIV